MKRSTSSNSTRAEKRLKVSSSTDTGGLRTAAERNDAVLNYVRSVSLPRRVPEHHSSRGLDGGGLRASLDNFLQRSLSSPGAGHSLQRSRSVSMSPQTDSGLGRFLTLHDYGNIPAILTGHQLYRQETISQTLAVAVDTLSGDSHDFFEDYFVRSMRLSLYLYLLPYEMERRLIQGSVSDAITEISNAIASLALFSDAQTQRCVTVLRAMDLGKVDRGVFFNYDIQKRNPIVDAVYENFFNQAITIAHSQAAGYFYHIDTQIKAFLETEIDAELSDINAIRVCEADVITLVNFCLSGKLNNDQLSDFVSGLKLSCLDMVVEGDSAAIENKKTFKQCLLARCGTDFMPALSGLYQHIKQRVELGNAKLQKDIDLNFAEKLQALEEHKLQCKADVISQVQAMVAENKTSVAAPTIAGENKGIVDKAGWYMKSNADGDGYSTVMKMQTVKRHMTQRTFTFVIDGSGSMNQYNRWQLTLAAVQSALRAAAEKWPGACRFSLFLFGNGAERIYHNCVVEPDVITQIAAADGPLTKARLQGDIQQGTYYIQAINKLIESEVIGSVFFLSDGEPSERTGRLNEYIVGDKSLKKHHLNLIPVFVTTPSETQNTMLRLLSQHSASFTEDHYLPVLPIHHNNIANVFREFIEQDLIPESFVYYKVKVFRVLDDNSEVELADLSGYVFCHGEESRVEIMTADAEFYKHYILKVYKHDAQLSGEPECVLAFGVNNYALKEFSDQWAELATKVRDIESDKTAQFNQGKQTLELLNPHTDATALPDDSDHAGYAYAMDQTLFGNGGGVMDSQSLSGANVQTFDGISRSHSLRYS